MGNRTWPDQSRYEAASQTGRRGRATPVDSVTQAQYDRAWDLISTGHTTSQILGATGLTRPQLDWLTKHGWDGRPGYVSRLADISARVRSRAQAAAEEISIGALDALKREMAMAKAASSLAAHLIQAHVQAVVIPTQQQLAAGGLAPDAAAALVAKMAPPKSILEALRTLRDYTKLEATARMYRTVFDSDLTLGVDSDRSTSVRLDLGAEKALSAAFAVVEDVQDHAAVAHSDPLDLLPEWSGWTLEEIEQYTRTGVMPDRVYADGRGDAELPEECLDQPFEG